jgi:WD40 repeat protein
VFQPDTIIATGSADMTVKIWKYNGLMERLNSLNVSYLNELRDNPAYYRNMSHYHVHAVAFDSGGTLAAGGRTTKVWWLQPKPEERWSLKDDSPVSSLAFNPTNENILATGYSYGRVNLWNLSSGNSMATLDLPDSRDAGAVTSIAFSPDGTLLVAGTSRGTALGWQLQLPPPHSKKKVSTSTNATATARLVMTTPPSQETDEYGDSRRIPITSVAFNSEGTLLATGCGNTAKLWSWRLLPDDLASVTCVATLNGHTDSVNSVAFHPSGGVVCTGSSDTTAKLWSFSHNSPIVATCVATLSGHSDSINSVGFSPNGHILSTGSSDSTAKLWDCRILSKQWQRNHLLKGFSGLTKTLMDRLSYNSHNFNHLNKGMARYVHAQTTNDILAPASGALLQAHLRSSGHPKPSKTRKTSPQGGSRATRFRTRSNKRKCTTLKRKIKHKKRKL